MASGKTWFSSEMEKGILLSETEENGIVTRTYIAPMLESEMVEIPDPLALPKRYLMPYFCPYCGNGIGSSGAFTMHLRACQRRWTDVDHEKVVPVNVVSQPATSEHLQKLERPHSNLKPGAFQCIFCSKEFRVQFEHGQVRRRYACDECGQRARAKEAERQKDPTVKRKMLSCDRCGKEYKLEGFLMRHQVICKPKRKREKSYTIHEVGKKESEIKAPQVTEAQLNNEIEEVSEIQQEDEIHKVSEVQLEGKTQEATEVKLEGQHQEAIKMKSEAKCQEDS